MTTLPAQSTPCTWNTFLARSTPMVLTCMRTTPSGDSLFNDHPLAHSMPGAGVVHYIIFDRRCGLRQPLDVCFRPKAPHLLRGTEMTRWPKRTPDAAAAYWRTEWHGQQLLRWSKVSTGPGGMTHESADCCCGPAVPRLERARSRRDVRLRLQRRGRRYRNVHAASGRFAAAGAALQGEQARDADGGELGQALPHRRRALQAIPGVQLQHRQELRRAQPRRHRNARRELSVYRA